MDPTLVAIFGPLRGSSFQMTKEEVSIGREPSNWLAVSDPLLSRKHCLIKKEADNFKIRDLESRNGIFVNGVPARERILQHGDQIQMGDSLFLFLLQEEGGAAFTEVKSDEEMLIARSTTQLKIEDALYLKPERVLAALPPTARIAQDLNALLKISKAVNSIQKLETLIQTLFELIFDVVPAGRAAVLLTDGKSYALDKQSGSSLPFSVTPNITDQVLRENIGLLGNDIQESGSNNGIYSLLCVPLVLFEKTFGVLYMDTADPTTPFDESHLQLVTAIAGIAAVALKNVQQMEWLVDENRRLQTDIDIEHGLIGESPPMRKVYEFIRKVAPTDSTVLISGESGTGKELSARAIHRNSMRAMKPFVAINCAALVEPLLESELFGHEKGAFTGASAQKKGKLEVADGGTIFLDEVTEMSPVLQAKLLRVLQEREFDRVGGTRQIHVDIRVIAATNKNLEVAVKEGTFRQDLYYRLNVVNLTMPPLRERREDIPLLASYFAAKYNKKFQSRMKGISPEARETLVLYDWPGNVRELENAMERAVVLGSTDVILQEDLPETLLEVEHPAGIPITKYHEGVKEAKKELILRAFDQANGNLNEAASLLGVNLTYVYRLIRNLNLKEKLKI